MESKLMALKHWKNVVLSLIVASPLAGGAAIASTLYDSGGFETGGVPPRFTAGQQLPGQDPVFGPWVTDNNVSSALVQTLVVQSGAQAVRVDRAAAANADQRWSPTPKPVTLSQRYLVVEWDERVQQTLTAGVNFGPLMGVESYDTDVLDNPLLIGAAFVDAHTGDVLYQAGGTGAIAETGKLINFGEWNHFAIQADYATNTYQVFLNGAQVASTGFVDGGIVGFSDAPLAAVAFGDTPADAAAGGTAFYDNYAVTTSSTAVPEPAVVSLLALVSCGIMARRRGKKC
jgi:hypothetical protein